MTQHSPICPFHVVIPCAGSGQRAGTQQPKQYQSIAGEPMVCHTLRAFSALRELQLAVVVSAPDDTQLGPILERLGPPWTAWPHGGATRAASVLQGLRRLQALGAKEDDWVLVHDAARCLVTPELIRSLLTHCAQDPVGGLLALPLPDTLKQSVGQRSQATLARDDKWLAQTPQMFRLQALAQALTAAGDAVTDEASALEAMGHAPRLVTSAAFNFKVTYPADFALAEAVLAARSKGTPT